MTESSEPVPVVQVLDEEIETAIGELICASRVEPWAYRIKRTDAAVRELRALISRRTTEDRERLDWLEAHPTASAIVHRDGRNYGVVYNCEITVSRLAGDKSPLPIPTLREIIDAARAARSAATPEEKDHGQR